MRKITNEEFLNRVKNEVGEEYTFLEDYINTNTKLLVRHNKCNYEYKVSPDKFFHGRRCPKCSNRYKFTNEEYCSLIKTKTNKEYSVIGEYINNKTKIEFKHEKCNKTFFMKPNDFQQGHRCPYCQQKGKRDTDYFITKVNNLVGDEYTVLGTYINNSTKIKIKHNKCGNIYEVQPKEFINHGRRCPYCCKESKGEKIIESYLIKNNIKYEKEKKFKDCKYKNPLPFDFYLEDYNTCIEYDGMQHYVNIHNTLKIQQIRDNIKNDYCKKNKINLLRIPYTKFDKIEYYINLIINENRPTCSHYNKLF